MQNNKEKNRRGFIVVGLKSNLKEPTNNLCNAIWYEIQIKSHSSTGEDQIANKINTRAWMQMTKNYSSLEGLESK